jgi:hypothetical protein
MKKINQDHINFYNNIGPYFFRKEWRALSHVRDHMTSIPFKRIIILSCWPGTIHPSGNELNILSRGRSKTVDRSERFQFQNFEKGLSSLQEKYTGQDRFMDEEFVPMNERSGINYGMSSKKSESS